MKKFIIKTAFFIIPFFILAIVSNFFSSKTEFPDLIRLGNFPKDLAESGNIFQKDSKRIFFNKLSEKKSQSAKILTIGDSFSEQDNFGYKNYLAEKHGVLHVDKFISGNQIQTLSKMLNGDFFEKHKVEYVILENVERSFITNSMKFDPSKKILESQLDSIIVVHKSKKILEENKKDVFFSKKTITFTFSLFRYYFDENYLSNDVVYNVPLSTCNLFNNHLNKLFFISDDLSNLEKNNNLKNVRTLNDILNDLTDKLLNKKIRLIVLPAPDKYDMYYDYISDKLNYTKPLFFQLLNSCKKKYIYIDSKKILSAKLKSEKDMYFFGDTHWSPKASKIISNEIMKVIH